MKTLSLLPLAPLRAGLFALLLSLPLSLLLQRFVISQQSIIITIMRCKQQR